MGKKLMLAVALVALMAAPAFASVQNVKVGGDLKTTSVIRNGFQPTGVIGTSLIANQATQNVVLSQVGLNIQADLTDNVSVTMRLLNERVWGAESVSNTDIDLDTAYVTMKEMLYSPLTVMIGRQPLAYGNQFIVGDVNGFTQAAVSDVSDLAGGVTADAIKAVLSYDPLTIDIFAAKINERTTVTNDKDDADLFGINANYKVGDSMNTVVEAYTFAKADKGTGEAKADKLYVPGLRVSTNPIEGLNVQLEGAYQFGDVAPVVGTSSKGDVSAYAFQGGVNYALPVMKDMKPVLSAGYTYISGDKDTSDNEVRDFQSMYENQNGGRIFDALGFGNNVRTAMAAIEITPVQDVMTKLSWYNLTQVKKEWASNRNTKIGNEVDLDVTYAYTEDVKLGVSAGMFYAGKYYDGLAGKENASQVLTSVAVAF